MANAMAHAIGAQAAQPGRQVVSMSGDGGFAMLMGDLITLTQAKLPVKVVINNNTKQKNKKNTLTQAKLPVKNKNNNNSVLGFVALEMKAAGFIETGVGLK